MRKRTAHPRASGSAYLPTSVASVAVGDNDDTGEESATQSREAGQLPRSRIQGAGQNTVSG